MHREKVYVLQKTLNNNAFMAIDNDGQEVVLIGKGIGFQRSKGEVVNHHVGIEKVFVLASKGQQEQIIRLFDETDEDIVKAITEYIKQVEQAFEQSFSTQFFIALTDHLAFAVKRLRQNVKIHNPFGHDIRILYPQEYRLAEAGRNFLEQRLQIAIPESEIGFLALHLHSGRTKQNVYETNRFSGLIAKAVRLIETDLNFEIDKNSVEYSRLLIYLRFAIEQAPDCISTKKPKNFLRFSLQNDFYECYNIAWKLVKILQIELSVELPDFEVDYLAIHIQKIWENSHV